MLSSRNDTGGQEWHTILTGSSRLVTFAKYEKRFTSQYRLWSPHRHRSSRRFTWIRCISHLRLVIATLYRDDARLLIGRSGRCSDKNRQKASLTLSCTTSYIAGERSKRS